MTALAIVSHAAVIVLVRDENLRTVLSDVLSPVGVILIAVTFFFTAHFTAYAEPRKAESWRLWAFALVLYALGDIIWAIFEVVLKEAPFPSIADFFYLLSYFFIWLGLVRYPVDKFSTRERKLVGLDNLIVVLGASLAFWVFLIHPMILASREVDFLSLLLLVAYPVFDMVFLWTLLIFFRNRLQQSTYIPLVLLGIGMFSQIIADSLFAYQSVNKIFISDSSIKLGWTAGLIFFLLAGIIQVNYTFAEKDRSQIAGRGKSFNSWPLYLPYIWLVLSYGILFVNISMGGNSLLPDLVVGLIVGLVIFRQVLTLNDNERLITQVEKELTDRKRMEAELSASEQRYRLLADNASDIIWSADMNLQMKYISPAVQKLRGYSIEEALIQNVYQSLTPESAEYTLQFFAQILMEVETELIEPLKGASRRLELEMIRKDGSTVWTETHVSFLLDEQNKPTGILGVSRDITERRQAEDSRQKAIAFEYESLRARELDILLKASEATSSSLDFDTVMHTLASQLLEISGFESCFISEWDKETNTIVGRLDDSRTFWREDLRDSYSMSDYPQSNQVLLTGIPIILQGDFEAEEKQWMDNLKRTAVITLAISSQEKIIGLAEIETTKKNKIFDTQVLFDCQKILANAAISIKGPLSANEPKKLFEIEDALLQAAGAEVCSFSEWDKPENRLYNLAVSTKITWASGQGTRFNPDLDSWRLALNQGQTITSVGSEEKTTKAIVFDGTETMEVESLIIFPLQKGNERIGVIELYDFNHKIQVTPEQITLLRTIADKASYSIENARLLQLTQKKLDEQIILLNEKEVLLKEIHHRVKNNLQIISSLLNLQSNRITDASTLQVLGDSQARIRSMALIHEKLYQSQSLAKIDFGEYVQSLATDLFRSYHRNITGIQLNVQVDEVALGLDQAVSCGLILNELITNTLKYAFPDGMEGTIWVELRSSPERVLSLRVADDGVGIPADFDILNTKSLGLQLVKNLVGQLDGKMELDHSEGTDIRVSFKY